MMLPILRAFNPFRKQGTLKLSSRLLFSREELHMSCIGSQCSGFTRNEVSQSDGSLYLARFFDTSFGSQKLLWVTRTFSSQADAKNSSEEVDDDLEDGFSELEDSIASDKIPESGSVDDSDDDELISGPELSEDDTNEIDWPRELLNVSDAEVDVVKKSDGRGESSGFFKFIFDSPTLPVSQVVEKWVEQGNEVSRLDYWLAMVGLWRRRMYVKALELSEWMEVTKGVFTNKDYACRVDLIAKLHGFHKAEQYITKIPQDCRTEAVYRSLLSCFVDQSNLKKSEEIFNKMKELGFPLTHSSYNQMLLLYKRLEKRKIADILLLMKQENVKPSSFTYRILIDAKGQSKDIARMDTIVEMMKSDDIELDFSTKAIIAKHYIFAGLKGKAEDMLKDLEETDVNVNRWACNAILPVYAALGKADDVERIWKVCESDLHLTDCIAAIDAYGKLQRIDKAEEVFHKLSKKLKKLPPRACAIMLRVYANNKMLSKGKDLVKRMAENDCPIGPLIWHSLVRLYIKSGELDKAFNVLQKATEHTRAITMFSSFMEILDQYANKGDIHNTEKVFQKMRQAGYVMCLRPFQTLVRAYVNGKAPAYGMRERMKAATVFPNKPMAAQLIRVDPFRKSEVSDLLD